MYLEESYCYEETSNRTLALLLIEQVHIQGLRNSSMALLQAGLAQQGLKTLGCTSDGLCFFSSVAHQLYNDPSYRMNVRAAGVEYIRNNCQRFIGPVTEQYLWVSYLATLSHQHRWCHALIVQVVSDAFNVTIRITESIEW